MSKSHLKGGAVKLPGSNGTNQIPDDFDELMLICEIATRAVENILILDTRLEIAKRIAELLGQFQNEGKMEDTMIISLVATVLDEMYSKGENKELSSKTKRNMDTILGNITDMLTHGRIKP